MTGYGKNRSKDALPVPRGNAPECACGCGNRTSTIRTQYVLGHRPPEPWIDRLMHRVEKNATTGCWDWRGSMFRNGYGRFMPTSSKAHLAHRAAYELMVGPIPDGLVLDHLCRNRACVNPAHLEPVTTSANNYRAVKDFSARRQEALSRPCPNGHDREAHSVIDRNGHLKCVQCGREASLRYYHQRKSS